MKVEWVDSQIITSSTNGKDHQYDTEHLLMQAYSSILPWDKWVRAAVAYNTKDFILCIHLEQCVSFLLIYFLLPVTDVYPVKVFS